MSEWWLKLLNWVAGETGLLKYLLGKGIADSLSFLPSIWKMKTIRETIIKIAVWVDRPEQSITHSCFGLRSKNVLLTAKACITTGLKQMGCLQCIYLQLFKLLVGEPWPVQTTQACPSMGHGRELLGTSTSWSEMLDTDAEREGMR